MINSNFLLLKSKKAQMPNNKCFHFKTKLKIRKKVAGLQQLIVLSITSQIKQIKIIF